MATAGAVPASAHPKYAEFKRFASVSPIHATVAWQVYIDLIEVKGWLDVRVHHSEQLQLTYLSACENKSAQREVVFPVGPRAALNMAKITTYFASLVATLNTEAVDGDTVGCKEDSLTMAIVDSDSTSSYYRIYAGLRAPPEKLVVGQDEDD